jgi:hypothetical protein
MVITLATDIFNVKMLFYFLAVLWSIPNSDGLNIIDSFGLFNIILLIQIYEMVMLDFCIT